MIGPTERIEPRSITAASTSRGPAERGGLTLLGAGITMIVLFTGGLAVDLGRAVALRAELGAAADAAAAAGANGIDTVRFREDGQVMLAPAVAEELARAQLADDWSGVLRSGVVTAEEDVVVVILTADSPLLFLGLFSGAESWAVRATASARPIASMPLGSPKSSDQASSRMTWMPSGSTSEPSNFSLLWL